MIQSFDVAARLPQTDPDQAAVLGEAEGQAVVALLRQFRDEDWQRPTDCTDWDVRTLVSHLVAQCDDSIRMSTLLRREVVGQRRYPDKSGVDAHMAVQVDDYRTDLGPELVERFARRWPRAVRARQRRPRPLRRIKIDLGIPGVPRVPFSYLLDVIYNRDLWMHRIDLAHATNHPFVIGDHDRHIVAQTMRDLALRWSTAPVALELTGPAGGLWAIGDGDPTAVIRADAVAYMRALAGRDIDLAVHLICGDESAVDRVRQATVPF